MVTLFSACRLIIKENSTDRDILLDNVCKTPMITQVPKDQITSKGAIQADRSSTRYYSIHQRYGATSVAPALTRVMSFLLPITHVKQTNLMSDHPLTINDQAVIRITRRPGMDERYGPTPEGIHQDNTQTSGMCNQGFMCYTDKSAEHPSCI